MRKQVTSASLVSAPPDREWVCVGRAGVGEGTYEDGGHPVESALLQGEKRGWRAAGPGPQTIRLVFDKPQKLRRIWLKFEETEIKRTQEFVLRWSPDGGRSYREIVRQQWNFSPPETEPETEDYAVELSDVTALELNIVPDKSGGEGRASFAMHSNATTKKKNRNEAVAKIKTGMAHLCCDFPSAARPNP